MIEIWGRKNSFNQQKVMWCVAELDIAYERIDAGGVHGVTDTTEYLALNPNGRVPTIEDNGFVLWESNAIVRYLSARHGTGTLCPDDPMRRADADRWMEWQSATMGAVMRPLIITMFRTAPDDRDTEATRRQSAPPVVLVCRIRDRRPTGSLAEGDPTGTPGRYDPLRHVHLRS